MSIISDLRIVTPQEPLAGYRGFSSYPTAYQAAEFPAHGDEIRITGNNQAFFFVSGVKDSAGQIVSVQKNVVALEKLIRNIVSQGTTADERPTFRLQIDADVFENTTQFVAKYQGLRSEQERSKREELLQQEAEIIRTFVNDGGIVGLAKQVLKEDAKRRSGGTELSNAELETISNEFFEKNFRLEGVRTQKPLQFSTWEIKAQDGTFVARQEYKNSTYMVDRPWQLGVNDDLTQLAKSGHKGAQQVLEAVYYTHELDTVDLTKGDRLPSLPVLAKKAPALSDQTPQDLLGGLTVPEWGLLTAASYYADKNGPEGRATNHQAYRQAYLSAMASSTFEIVDSLHDRMTGTTYSGGAAIVAFQDKRTGSLYVSMAGLESDGHTKKQAIGDLFKDAAELILTNGYYQARALVHFMEQLEKKYPDQKKVILSHSMSTKSAMVMAAQYPVILFQPRGISSGALKAIARLRHKLFSTEKRPSQDDVLRSLEDNAVIIKGRQSPWNSSILANTPILANSIPVIHTRTNKHLSLLDDHKADVISAGAASLFGQDFKVTLHPDIAVSREMVSMNRPNKNMTFTA